MPEGDTVHKSRRLIDALLTGRRIVRAECRWPRVVEGLAGREVVRTEARGKHLLLYFDDDTAIRVHLGMPGRWHRYDPGERWTQPRAEMGIVLETLDDVLVCFQPPEVERLRVKEIAIHPVLSELGPDLLDPAGVDLDDILARARSRQELDPWIADCLLDQRVAAGIGNIYKSEVLFLERLSPWARTAEVSDEKLKALFKRGARLLRANLGLGPRNTTGRPYPLLWVYGAGSRPCPRCGGRIQREHQGNHDRLTWWCPRCQPGGAPPPVRRA